MAVQAKRWRTKAVADATEIPTETLFRFLDRRIITSDAGDPGSGRPRMFGMRSIYRIAIVHRLTRAGLPPAAAKKLADQFCDQGQGGRQPGALFPTGRTLLIASQDGAGKIVNLATEAFLDEVIGAKVTIVVDLGRIVAGVNMRLGLATPPDRDVDGILREFCNQPI
jgi:DNA-binding transcriptional MerR regulator